MDAMQVDLRTDCGFEQGDALADGWRVLGDHRIELAIGAHKPELWAGSTRCVKIVAKRAGPLFRLTAAISIRHLTGSIAYAVFFQSKPIYIAELFDVGSAKLSNMNGLPGVEGIGAGGCVAIAVVASESHSETVEDRRNVCRVCPSGMFRPAGRAGSDACLALSCCNKREPDPDRWRLAIENGSCPRSHFQNRGGFAVKTPIRSGKLLIGSQIVPTL